MAAMTPADIHAHFDLQHQASRAQPDVPLLVRRERLLRIRKMLDEHGPVLAAAVQADFGMRSPRLTEVADFFVLRTLLSHTLKHLAKWMKPQKVHTPIYLQPASAHIQRQPLGVVGVISPWNYPVQLALVWALRAGWARLTGRPVTPWVMRMDPRTGFSTVFRSTERWSAGRRGAAPAAPDASEETAASRRGGILPGAAEVTDVEAREVR